MKAIGVAKDQPLFVEDVPTPQAGAGEVLIRVAAAGLNRADIMQRAGKYPPPPGASPIMGMEVSGVIEACGAGAARFKPGDKVCALIPGGGYAQFVTAHEGSVLPAPKSLSLEEAGAIPEAVFTVYANVFESGALQPGEVFLVHGGASGIGTTAIQMAKAHGCAVFATAGDDEKCALVERLGARAINYKTQDFESVIGAAGGVDVILDMIGGPYLPKNVNILKPLGRLAHIATMGGAKAELNLLMVMGKRLIVTGSTLRGRAAPEKARLAKAVETIVWPWIESGAVKPVIDSVFPLDQAEAAHARMAAGAHAGKIILTM